MSYILKTMSNASISTKEIKNTTRQNGKLASPKQKQTKQKTDNLFFLPKQISLKSELREITLLVTKHT